MWLLAGLGVLIWAAFSVLIGGSSAHAADKPTHPSHSQSQQQAAPEQTRSAQRAQPQRAHAPQAQPQPKSAQRQAVAPRPSAVQKAAVQKAAAVHKAVVQKRQASQAAPQRVAAQLAVAPQQRAQARTVTHRATPAAQRGHDRLDSHVRGGSDRAHARNADRHDARIDRFAAKADRHAKQAERRAEHAAKIHATKIHATKQQAAPAHRAARVQHQSRAAAVPVHTIPVITQATGTATSTFEQPARNAPADTHGVAAKHPLSTPPSVSSAAAGPAAAAGDLPGAMGAGDVLGPLLTATRADDDVLPSGPTGTPDDSPD
jgi:hypothetical protein